MIYVYWYLAVGVVVLAFVFGTHWLAAVRESMSSGKLLTVVALVLANSLLVALWPVAVFMKSREVLTPEAGSKAGEEPVFSVERQHLLERLSLQEVERREVVTDPLNAVPGVPFGHLHAAWSDFLSAQAGDGELWSFSVRWQPNRWRRELRSGYVLVRSGLPGAYFLTTLRDLPDDAGPDEKT